MEVMCALWIKLEDLHGLWERSQTNYVLDIVCDNRWTGTSVMVYLHVFLIIEY